MTRQQSRCLEFLRRWFAEHEIGPSYAEMAAGLGYKSKTTPFHHVQGLAARGLVSLGRGHARSISLIETGPGVAAAARRLLDNVIEEDLEKGVARVRVEDLGDLDIALAEAAPGALGMAS